MFTLSREHAVTWLVRTYCIQIFELLLIAFGGSVGVSISLLSKTVVVRIADPRCIGVPHTSITTVNTCFYFFVLEVQKFIRKLSFLVKKSGDSRCLIEDDVTMK